MTSERTRRLKYIRRGPLYSNLQWNREPILLSSRANLCGMAPLNTTSTAAEIATEVLGRRLTTHMVSVKIIESMWLCGLLLHVRDWLRLVVWVIVGNSEWT